MSIWKRIWITLKEIDRPAKVLPVLLAILTRKPRYLPDIQWSSKSWVHNIFRVYELIFWRRVGIRAESASWIENGKLRVELYSFEAVCAHVETLIREFFNIKWLDIKIEAYQFAIASGNGTGGTRIPWISFAVALDVSSLGSTATVSPVSHTHTCTGSNLLLAIAPAAQGTSGSISSSKYNSVDATISGSERNSGTSVTGSVSLWLLVNPATGANSVSVAWTGWTRVRVAAVSYSGCKQTGQPDASAGNSTTSANPSVTVTTVADNCWALGVCGVNSSSVLTAGLTQRQAYVVVSANKASLQDTNAAVSPAGNQTVNWTITSTAWGLQAASIAPFVANVTIGEMMTAINLPTNQPTFEQIGVVPY